MWSKSVGMGLRDCVGNKKRLSHSAGAVVLKSVRKGFSILQRGEVRR